jgi:GT2 family glycosyltransferase
MPRVSVIVPTWNGRPLLEVSLAAMATQRFRDFELIVVDNGSSDDTVTWLRACYPAARVVQLPENRGFAEAVNAGMRIAQGDIVALLNNDTEAAPDWLERLVCALDANPGIGFCASKVLNFYDRDRIDSAGDMLGLLADQIGHGEQDGPAFDQPRPVLSACAAAAAYRRELFAVVGLFDERFVSYLEDVDIGIRAQYAGYSALYVPDAVVYHMVSATARRMNDRKLLLLLRNSLFLFFQYMPPRVVLQWGAVMLVWPFVHVVRVRAPLKLAVAAVIGFLRDVPAVYRRRRNVRGTRVITDAALLERLSPPVGRAGTPAPTPATVDAP